MEWEKAYTREQSGLTTDERMASLFQPDTLLSAQYFENLRRKTLVEPEKRLMLAILEDAVNCFQDNVLADRGKGKKLFDDVEEWIVEPDGDWIFSFEYICEALGFNPEYLRRGLLHWKEKNRPKHLSGAVWEEKKMAG